MNKLISAAAIINHQTGGLNKENTSVSLGVPGSEIRVAAALCSPRVPGRICPLSSSPAAHALGFGHIAAASDPLPGASSPSWSPQVFPMRTSRRISYIQIIYLGTSANSSFPTKVTVTGLGTKTWRLSLEGWATSPYYRDGLALAAGECSLHPPLQCPPSSVHLLQCPPPPVSTPPASTPPATTLYSVQSDYSLLLAA